jgi:hypothetical protein
MYLLRLAQAFNLKAEFSWTEPLFRKLIKNYNEDKQIEWLELNEEKLFNIEQTYGIPQYLNEGVFGVAFSLGNNRVLKIMREYDYNQIKKVYDFLYSRDDKAKYLVNIYEIGEFDSIDIQSNKLYYAVLERVKHKSRSEDNQSELHDKLNDVIHGILPPALNKIRMIKMKREQHDNTDITDDEVKSITNEIFDYFWTSNMNEEQINNIKDIINYFGNGEKKWFYNFIKSVVVLVVKDLHRDIHTGNFGTRENAPHIPVHFDF